MRVAIVCLCLLGSPWAGLAVAGAAEAEERAALVLLVDPGDPALSARLREEVEALGLEVTLVPEQDPYESLEARARGAEALAAIRVTRSGAGAVEMTIVDRATGKIVSRRLAISTQNDPAAAELIATRTVELLRASLMELGAEHPARGELTPTSEIEALAAPAAAPEPAGTFAVAAGPGLAYVADLGTSFDAFLSLTLVAKSQIGVTAQILLPVTNQDLVVPEGRVELVAARYRLGAVFETERRPSIVHAQLQAGAELARLTLSGSADTPYYGASDDLLAVGAWIGASVRWGFAERLGLVLGGHGELVFPRTVIRAGGREAATFGRPLVSGVAALEVAWW